MNLKKERSGDYYPKLICEECTTELVLVAKFREKCAISSATLDQLSKQMEQKARIEPKDNGINHNTEKHCTKTNQSKAKINESKQNSQNNHEIFYENLEYVEDNVEYVIFDNNSDFIEEIHVLNETDGKTKKLTDDENTPNHSKFEEVLLLSIHSFLERL